MNTLSVFDELDQAIDQILANAGTEARTPKVEALLELAPDLQLLPSPQFKTRLKAELLWTAAGARPDTSQRPAGHSHNSDIAVVEDRRKAVAGGSSASGKHVAIASEREMLPTLLGRDYHSSSARRSNFVASVALHLAAVVAIVSAYSWMAQHATRTLPPQLTASVGVYVPPVGTRQAHGGGGGGDHSVLPASRGTMTPSLHEQIVPPMVNENHLHPLTAEATVVAPELHLEKNQTGDPLAAVLVPSNGTGTNGGIGTGSHGGAGSGDGNGVGLGHSGGIGGGIYRIGNGVSAPRAIYDPDPEYSEEARKAKWQGTVLLWAVVGPDGHVRDLRVQHPLGMGLDEKALEAVRTWRFDPATKDGHPVAVQISIEVGFRLY